RRVPQARRPEASRGAGQKPSGGSSTQLEPETSGRNDLPAHHHFRRSQENCRRRRRRRAPADEGAHQADQVCRDADKTATVNEKNLTPHSSTVHPENPSARVCPGQSWKRGKPPLTFWLLGSPRTSVKSRAHS